MSYTPHHAVQYRSDLINLGMMSPPASRTPRQPLTIEDVGRRPQGQPPRLTPQRVWLSEGLLRAMDLGVRMLIPWPSELLGEYGSDTFNGSPVSRESQDRLMDQYAMDLLRHMPDRYEIRTVIPGRTQRGEPVITVQVAPEGRHVDRWRDRYIGRLEHSREPLVV